MENEASQAIDLKFSRVDGEVAHCRVACLPMGAETSRVALKIALTDITRKKKFEAGLQDIDNAYRSILATTLDGFWRVDAQGRFLDVNSRYVEQSGYSRDELLQMSVTDVEAVEGANDTAAHIRKIIETGRDQFESMHRRKDGSTWHVEVSATYREVGGGQFFVFLRDISQRKRDEAALQESERLLNESQSIAGVGSYVLDFATGLLKNSAVANRMLGVEQNYQHSVAAWFALIHPDDREMLSAYYDEVIAGHAETFEKFFRIIRQNDQSVRWIHELGRLECDDSGRPVQMRGTLQDITERKEAADKIEYLAFYDALTGLPNRKLMLDRLGRALYSSARHHRHGALMLIDMDNFKALNDTLGHDIGDQLLIEVALRLESCVRECDTVARLGGDEFVVILEDLDETDLAAMQAEHVAVKIRDQLGESYLLDLAQEDDEPSSRSHHCSSSIGVTLFCDQSVSVDELMKRADTAMYQAKAAGRNTLRFFDPQMQAAVKARAAMEVDLRKAIVESQFLLHYQAQVDLSGRVIGAECLVRWQHPERGLVLPMEFIPLAEDTGLILSIGHWVLVAACQLLSAWANSPQLAHITLAVNVSARQFSLPNFVDEVLALLEYTGTPPNRLKLELTESLLFENAEDIIAKMTALKARGVVFSMDDFGTGYSSLSYLKRLPLDQLKIDQSFVRHVLTDANDAAIARTVVALGQSLGLAVMAEGVETQGQRDFLAANGCHTFQGYLFSHPLPLEGFTAFAKDSLSGVSA
jgi:diguanylate cyclase (GGDEF)-like protein/PAS domain S-box-containing protein